MYNAPLTDHKAKDSQYVATYELQYSTLPVKNTTKNNLVSNIISDELEHLQRASSTPLNCILTLKSSSSLPKRIVTPDNCKGSPYSITERRVSQQIPVLGSKTKAYMSSTDTTAIKLFDHCARNGK